MTSQTPAFRLTVARQMAAYRQRLADRIDQELQRRGEDHTDLAYALKVSPRTAERWIAGTTEPQRRLRKPIADYFGAAIEDFWPDLQSEERALRDQLDRIEAGQSRTEAKLDQLLAVLTQLAAHDGDDDPFGLAKFGREVRRLARPAHPEDHREDQAAPAPVRRQARG